jgi:UDP-glucuronate 4-epimerase
VSYPYSEDLLPQREAILISSGIRRMNSQQVLITGGAGFIGSHLAEKLLAEGMSVICLDNFDDYYEPQIKRSNIAGALQQSNYQFVEGDIRDLDQLSHLFARSSIHAVVHLAARPGVRPSLQWPALYEQVNVQGTLHVLEMAHRYGVKRVLFGSSSSVYGEGNASPSRETDRVDQPRSVYAATKRAGELLARTYHQLYDISIGCLRFFTVYGPRQRPEMAIHKFVRLINRDEEIPVFGDGSSERDYTYIDDIIDGIEAALHAEYGFEIINLGDNQPIQLSRLIELIERNLSQHAHIQYLSEQPGDVNRTCAHIGKAQKLLGYAPRVPIEKGISLFVQWYQTRNEGS